MNVQYSDCNYYFSGHSVLLRHHKRRPTKQPTKSNLSSNSPTSLFEQNLSKFGKNSSAFDQNLSTFDQKFSINNQQPMEEHNYFLKPSFSSTLNSGENFYKVKIRLASFSCVMVESEQHKIIEFGSLALVHFSDHPFCGFYHFWITDTVGIWIKNFWIVNFYLFAVQMPGNSLLFKPWSEYGSKSLIFKPSVMQPISQTTFDLNNKLFDERNILDHSNTELVNHFLD